MHGWLLLSIDINECFLVVNLDQDSIKDPWTCKVLLHVQGCAKSKGPFDLS